MWPWHVFHRCSKHLNKIHSNLSLWIKQPACFHLIHPFQPVNRTMFPADARKAIKCRPFALLHRNKVGLGALHYVRYLCNVLAASSCAAVSTSIKTTISRKQQRLETWEQRLEIFYFLNATCFWGLKGKKPILLFSGEIPRERSRMTITNASPEAKQYNGFCAFISLVGSHKSSNKPQKTAKGWATSEYYVNMLMLVSLWLCAFESCSVCCVSAWG